MPTLEEHNEAELAKFTTTTFEDGVEASGDMTAEERAALAANAAVEVPPGAQAPNEVKDDKPTTPAAPKAPDPAAIAAAAKAKSAAPAPDPNAPAPKPWEAKTEAEYHAAVEAAAKKVGQKRISELTGAKHALERELAAAKATPAAPASAPASNDKGGLTAAPAGGTTEQSAKPDPSKFTYGELDPEYIAALATYTVSTKLAEKEAKEAGDRQAQAAAAAQAEFAQKRDAAITAGTAVYPDFNEVVVESAAREEWPLTPALGTLIFDSPHGHHVAYYLATHADEAKELAKQSPANQAKWFGRVEAAFEGGTPSQSAQAPAAKKPVQAPKAPPPLREPATSQTTHEVGTDTEDFAAFERLMRDRARR